MPTRSLAEGWKRTRNRNGCNRTLDDRERVLVGSPKMRLTLLPLDVDYREIKQISRKESAIE